MVVYCGFVLAVKFYWPILLFSFYGKVVARNHSQWTKSVELQYNDYPTNMLFVTNQFELTIIYASFKGIENANLSALILFQEQEFMSL